jgi:hypothetical protein
MKSKVITTHSSLAKKLSNSALLKGVFIALIFLVCNNANAQIGPASCIRGPVKASVNDTAIVFTCEISTEIDPVTAFQLVNNTSGAVIVSKGQFIYNHAEGTGRQTVTVKPGTSKGSFMLRSEATTSQGIASASISITVVE